MPPTATCQPGPAASTTGPENDRLSSSLHPVALPWCHPGRHLVLASGENRAVSQARAGAGWQGKLWVPPGDGSRPPLQQDEVDILGLDGHIYKGRMDTRLPIPGKDSE